VNASGKPLETRTTSLPPEQFRQGEGLARLRLGAEGFILGLAASSLLSIAAPPAPGTHHCASVLPPASRLALPALPLRLHRGFSLCSEARPKRARLARAAARRGHARRCPPHLGHLPAPAVGLPAVGMLAGGLRPPRRRAGHSAHLAGSLGSCDADLGDVRVVRLAGGGGQPLPAPGPHKKP